MKRLVIGMLAHVDAGKTTLSEAMLYEAGALRKRGRVDHGDAFLDTHALERARGITIFTKQAMFTVGDTAITLIDTPGHADFSGETARALQVLDCAVLVISATDGVQAHTRTLHKLLSQYRVPVFVFVNKTDLPGFDKASVLKHLRAELFENCIDLTEGGDALWESAAATDETLLESYLEHGALTDAEFADAIERRALFPVLFGSALRGTGVDALLDAVARYAKSPLYGEAFGARVFKISYENGVRTSWMKVTGGRLTAKMPLTNRRASLREDDIWQEKADRILLYSGARAATVSEAEAGTVCAVTGLTRTVPGEGLGIEASGGAALLDPVLRYRVRLADGTDPIVAMGKLRTLEDEEPTLRLEYDARRREIRARLMGEVQCEVLAALAEKRFGLRIAFDEPSVLYRETIEDEVRGIGHYEPLKHYAHVELRLAPNPRGSRITLSTEVSEDVLARNWQRLILTHLAEKRHIGVLTGAPVTDIHIALVGGRAHLKHTEGGDFRQATYRAVRQGLMRAKSVLLEPYYAFRLEVPESAVGRAMADIRRMDGTFELQDGKRGRAVLTGAAPVAAIGAYVREVASYTRGEGALSLVPDGYRPCRNAEAVIRASGYDAEADTENTPDSVYCAHGAGYTVKWSEVSPMQGGSRQSEEAPRRAASASAGTKSEDDALMAIYERTYGKVKDRAMLLPRRRESAATTETLLESVDAGEPYLLVDGYNIVFAWDELSALAKRSLDLARETLIRLLIDYQGCRGGNVIAVFDAYRVTGGEERVERAGDIHIVYTREAEIADVYIERVTKTLEKRGARVRVATSDALEQLIVLGGGALRVPARAFIEEVRGAGVEVRRIAEALRERDRAEKREAYSIAARMREKERTE